MANQTSGVLSPMLQRRRIRAVLPHIVGTRVLDAGCGTGRLARYVRPRGYVGVDVDPDAIREARRRHPLHCFLWLDDFPNTLIPPFDTIAALAVIEHVSRPDEWLAGWARHLAPRGRFVLTTPHPRFRRAHEIGASAGIFSREAAEEHESLLDRSALERAGAAAGLCISHYERFLWGANQLFVLERVPAAIDASLTAVAPV